MTTKTTTPTATHVSPLYSSPIPTADGRTLPTAGKAVCRWIERHLVLGEGDWYGQPFVLRPFQRRFIYRLYEFYPETGQRRYRRALFGCAKGNGKTPLAAAIGAVELRAGIAVSPHVIVAAASLKQANTLFADLKTGVTLSPTLQDTVEPYDLQILLTDGPGLAERVAAAEGTNDGARATAFLADELHEWLGRLGRVFTIVDGAVAKRRNAFSAAFTTASVEDADTPLVDMYEHGKKVALEGLVDDSFLFEWYEAPAGLDIDDPEQRLTAIRWANPAAGDFNDIDSIEHRFMTIPRHEFERYHLNRFPKSIDTWEIAALWDALANPKIHLDTKLPLFVMVDIGLRHDSAAVVWGQRKKTERVVMRSKVWENPWPPTHPNNPEWKLPIAEVENHLRELRGRYLVKARDQVGPAFFYDQTFFERSAQDLEDEGLNMIDYPQTDSRMIPASQTFFQLVKEGLIVHDGDATFARHVKSVVPHEKPRGWRISKPRGSRRHIDAAVAAAVVAVEATRTFEQEGKPQIFI